MSLSLDAVYNDFAAAESKLTARDFVFAWCTVAMLAFMAVGWRAFGNTPFGVLRYFDPPLVVVFILGRNRMALFRKMNTIVVVFIYYTLAYAVISWFNRIPPLALAQGIYIVAAFTVAASLTDATVREWRIYRWAGPISAAAFVYFFFSDAARAGVHPISIVRTGVFHNSRNLIEFGLFQPVFNARVPQNLFNSTALRGQVVAGIIVSVLFSAYARSAIRGGASIEESSGRKSSPVANAIFAISFWASAFLGAILVVISLARAIELDLALAILLPVVKVIYRGRARLTTALALLLGATVLAVALVTPIASLLGSRIFKDTGSYSARTQVLGGAFNSIGRSPLIGQNVRFIDPNYIGPHNFILDATVNAGIFVGLIAAVFVLLVFRDLLRGIGAYFSGAAPLWPIAAAIFVPVAIFTSGGGTMQIPDCMGLALFYGTMMARTSALPPTEGLLDSSSLSQGEGVSGGTIRTFTTF